MITIHNLRRVKPRHPYDVRVDRASILGNPYFMADESERDKVCDEYNNWFEYEKDGKLKSELLRIRTILQEHGQLRLFCWCAPKRCHAETIKKWLEENA